MAVHVMTLLANNCDERLTSASLAKSVNTNAVVVRRLLCDLHDAGLVVSRTGYSGGTCLTRPPKEISLLDVYRAVSHGEVFALHKQKPDEDCLVGRNIESVLCTLQKDIDEVVEKRLKRFTLRKVILMVGKREKASV